MKEQKIDSLSNEELLLERFKAKDLTEEELRDIVFEDSVATVVDKINDNDRRWTRTVSTIVELKGLFFSIVWEQGLTECQEDSFDNQPYQVERKEEIITKTIVSWCKV